jgi:hypothetical protein
MSVQIKLRRDTSANWAIVNPVLGLGEPGLETDTLKIKYGDGTSPWNSIPYPTVLSTPTPAAALTGTTIPPNIINSSLTSVGTLIGLTVTNPIQGSITGNAVTATTATTATSAVNATNAVNANIATTLAGGANYQIVYQTGTGQITYMTAPALGNTWLNWTGSAYAWSQLPAAAAGTLTGATLASNVLTSSLTSIGTLTNLTVTNPIAGSVTGSAGSVNASNLTGTSLPAGITSAVGITSIGTLTNLVVTNTITGSVNGSSAKTTNIIGGNGSTLLGSVPYQSGTDTTTLLSPNTSSSIKVLTQTGNGTNGAAPIWTTSTGTGSVVFNTSPSLTTPALGVATATSINGLAITTSTGTLTVTNAKTLSVSNTLTLTGTDASSVAFGAGGTVAYTANKLSAFAATSSSELLGTISDETGTGVLVFGTSPTITTSIVAGSASMDIFNTTATTVNAFGAATSLTLGYSGTDTSTHNIATGIAANTKTKTINIGTGGAVGSITAIAIGTSTATGTTNTFTLYATTASIANDASNLTIGNTFTGQASISIGAGSTDTSTYNLFTGATANAKTKAINLGTNGISGSTTNISIGSGSSSGSVIIDSGGSLSVGANSPTINIGNSINAAQTLNLATANTDTSTYNIATGVTASAKTKTINIGTGGASGSFTTISIGSTTGTSTITLNGNLAAGTLTVPPLKFTSGTNLTTPAGGAIEYDGAVFYATPSVSTRSVVVAEQFTVLTTAYSATLNQTGAQKLFNTSTNGTVTLAIGNYQFECMFTLSNVSNTSSSFGFSLVGGTGPATFTYYYYCEANKTASLATAGTAHQTYSAAANTTLVAASAGTSGIAFIKGYINVTVAGTLIPQFSLTAAVQATVGVGSYFKVSPLSGTNIVGNWS